MRPLFAAAGGSEAQSRASVGGPQREVKYTARTGFAFTQEDELAEFGLYVMMLHVVRAIILAAGASSRMGRPKAALPVTDQADTFLSRVIRTCMSAGLPEIVVVSGAHDEVVRTAARPFGSRVHVVHNESWQQGQLSSLLTGLQWSPSAELEAVLMTLVDVPLTAADTYARVLRAWRTTRAPIVRPARGETHGHPVIFDRSVFDELRAADLVLGAKVVVRAHAHEIVNVSIEDEGAFVDVDTSEEYRAMRQLRN